MVGMPVILHAVWLTSEIPLPGGKLFVWAENTDFSHSPQQCKTSAHSSLISGNGSRSGREQAAAKARSRSAQVPSHPGQIPLGQLRQQLLERFSLLLARHMKPANVTVWLPSSDGAPIARRGLFQPAQPDSLPEHASTATPAQPALWQVTGLTLPPLVALTMLTQLADGGGLNLASTAPGDAPRMSQQLRPGGDLLFWSDAAKLALEILVGQHYLPSLRADAAGKFRAIWQIALLDEHMRTTFEETAQEMPPVCRAYNLASPAVALAPTVTLEHFVGTLVDSAVRAWGGSALKQSTPALLEAGVDAVDTAPALHWLNHLLCADNVLNLPPQPAYQLYRHWHAWMEQLQAASDANFRICLKLEEPAATADDGLTWRLHYLLQARDNPQLLIPAERIWSTEGSTLRHGDRRIDQPQERLLAGLGAISRLFEPIARSLRSPRPEVALLSTDEAYQFLREVGPLLENSGFGVLLPSWWQDGKRTRIGLRLHLFSPEPEDEEWGDGASMPPLLDEDGKAPGVNGAGPSHSDGAGLNAPIRYSWELMLGGRPLSKEEFSQLASMHTPLVYLRDQWIELDPSQMDAAQRFLNTSMRTGSMSLLQALRLSQGIEWEAPAADSDGGDRARRTKGDESLMLPALPELDAIPTGLSLDGVQTEGWLQQVLQRLRSYPREVEIPEPAGFTGELRPYQRRGVAWLAYLRQLGLGACLADDMGLGKTIQAIALHLYVRNAEQNGSGPNSKHCPTLLICPTSVLANWQHEIERFAPGLRTLIHHGNNRLSGDEFFAATEETDFVITSYGTTRRDIDLLEQCDWLDIILDEAQNIKNPGAKQTQAVRRLRARNRIALTGTPVENRLVELWSISEFLNPGYLGKYERFRKQYIVPIERYNDGERAAQLRRLVQPFLLRRLKTDPAVISDLPEKNEMVVYCALSAEQRKLYEATLRDSFAKLQESSGIQRRGLVLGLLTKLKQICNHPAQYQKERSEQIDFENFRQRSGKMSRLYEMLEEVLAAGDRALIFTQFVEMGELLRTYLNEALGTDILFLHGGTSATQRHHMVQLFQSDDGPPIFILSLRAGGYGLNLTHANHVFHFDRWWNPAVENQATDRAFRIGQQRNVQVHKFVVAGTLEERIHDLIESKQQLAENIVGSGEDWLTEMDTDELHALLSLQNEMTRTLAEE